MCVYTWKGTLVVFEEYAILSGILPIDFLISSPNGFQEAAIPMIDRIINVCSVLVNLCPGIGPFDRLDFRRLPGPFFGECGLIFPNSGW